MRSKEIADLKKQREALIARMSVIYQLQADRIQVVRVFDELARKLPEGVYLTTFRYAGSSISLQGVAQSMPGYRRSCVISPAPTGSPTRNSR